MFLFLCFLFVVHGFNRGINTTSNSLHSNNWAVLIGASRYWFNYRHQSNALAIYRTLKDLGIPDSQIILMLSDDMACNPRNCLKPHVYMDKFEDIEKRLDLYGNEVMVDYRGDDVSVENVMRVLSGKHPINTPKSKRLDTDENSNVLLYMTGHGAENFLKFHDKEEIQSADLSEVFAMMEKRKRFNEVLMMVDTCQAASMSSTITTRNVFSIASARTGESSYSYGLDHQVGLTTSDRFTFNVLDWFKKGLTDERNNLTEVMLSMDHKKLLSHHQWEDHYLDRSFNDVRVTDFFAATNQVILFRQKYAARKKRSEERPPHPEFPSESWESNRVNNAPEKESEFAKCSTAAVALMVVWMFIGEVFMVFPLGPRE